ncbi:GRIP and coiled-coil domain-containing protein-like isoform X2 [Harmonia axyridis]|uniref:GRIP and coiled-coil domain-containing protein-like isoform X2 n=1 Tax=Harmonia axyridis TaxID=115357 RepID=UPI001E275135|nr:GRIP and coiled-coil domain-containing protein-like isoform X2 [Harmonia axyridis]
MLVDPPPITMMTKYPKLKTKYFKIEDKSMETEVSKLKEELLQAQTALDKQTRRCRQLVGEFTRKLQEKESQYEHEKTLREDQLAKLLRALLLVEARLKQEQKLITHQLKEKDFIIQKQSNDLKKLLSGQYCKNCSQIYNSSANLESLDSSSEYIITDYQESNFGSLDSSSELYATLSDKDSSSNKSHLLDDSGSNGTTYSSVNAKPRYQKNRGKDSLERRVRKIPHRKSVGTYFEVLKLRNENASPYSNEDNTSNDYDNFDSLPPESVADQMSVISRDSESSYQYELIEKNDIVYNNEHDVDTLNNLSLSESNITVIHAPNNKLRNTDVAIDEACSNENIEGKETNISKHSEHKLSDSIQVFDADADSNDTWYVNASDQEDEQQKNVYRNNPVLECVNQILLQNINDNLNSPPKTPNIERKANKNKRVKFSDENILISEDQTLTQENLNAIKHESHNYYETPVHKVPNFYESPQSIYSNDYEQILSRCSETFSSSSDTTQEVQQEEDINHSENNENLIVLRKNKILRVPPALPPKPSNLLSKYKIQNNALKLNVKNIDAISLDSEPDYCSISELNLPENRITPKKIQVIAEINPSAPKDTDDPTDTTNAKSHRNEYDPVENNEMIMKTIEKVNIQVAKQTIINMEESSPTQKSPSKLCQEIPKLPQVSEIIIPEDSDKEKDDMITQDNYVKNNSQMMKVRNSTPKRRPISMGSSVSTLIMGFNNRELMYELQNKKPAVISPPKKIFSSFENLHLKSPTYSPKAEVDNQSQNDYNLIQNFEEFKLDDCEIEEYIVPDSEGTENSENTDDNSSVSKLEGNIGLVRTVEGKGKSDEDLSIPTLNRKSLELLRKQLQIETIENEIQDNKTTTKGNEPTYEHFLECTGLSSKSILTPSRITTTHKTVLKPRDIKLRSRTKAYGFFDTASIGSGPEPFV